MPLALGAFLASLLAGEVIRRIALWRALLDTPNARSLHTDPVPRLGGVGIAATTALLALMFLDLGTHARLLLAAACALGVIGLRDDLRPLSSAVRFGAQIAIATALLWRLGVPRLELLPGLVIALPALAVAATLVVWLVGVLNVYNFMDGMDGLAGAQTAAAAFALAVVHRSSDLGPVLVVLGASALGFLAHNLPPARMFLGDGGSYFIGTAIACAAITGLYSGVSLLESALAIAPFLLDGTFTILRRALRGEKIWQAHRSHLYQRAVQTGLSHREVLLVYLVWIGTTTAAAAYAAHSTPRILLGWGVALGGLLLVRSWVGRRESERAEAA